MNCYLRVLCTVFLAALLVSCATTSPHLSYAPGVRVETLSAAVSLSVSRGEQGMGTGGYLLYRRPDRMRLVILSPFGTTMMEVFVAGDRITIVDLTKSTAFSGLISELPDTGEGDTWRQARWVMEVDTPGSGPLDGTLERVNSSGIRETVTYENGLIVLRRLANGDEARYSGYGMVNGVPLATEIIMHSASGGRFRIKVSDPEVNGELAAEAFTPLLDGLTLYPLAALQKQ
jgi:hypothetical protein